MGHGEKRQSFERTEALDVRGIPHFVTLTTSPNSRRRSPSNRHGQIGFIGRRSVGDIESFTPGNSMGSGHC
jgi:hypothetical protein